MAEPEQNMAPEEATDHKGGRSKLSMAAVVLVTLGLGSAVGMKTVGPKVGAALAQRSITQAASAEDESSPPLHVVDNLVVNPAGSGGSRFLLTSVALEAGSAEEATMLEAKDMQIRDSFILVLGSKTVEQLSDIKRRAQLSKELLAAVDTIVGPDVVKRLFIPQFVIQ